MQTDAAVAVAITAGYAVALTLLALAPPSFPATVTVRAAAGLAIAFLITGGIGAGAALISVARLDPAMTMGAA